jgi:hypothetical protein
MAPPRMRQEDTVLLVVDVQERLMPGLIAAALPGKSLKSKYERWKRIPPRSIPWTTFTSALMVY